MPGFKVPVVDVEVLKDSPATCCRGRLGRKFFRQAGQLGRPGPPPSFEGAFKALCFSDGPPKRTSILNCVRRIFVSILGMNHALQPSQLMEPSMYGSPDKIGLDVHLTRPGWFQ